MLHSTGANNPNLKRYVQPDDGKLGTNSNGNHWNQPTPDGISKCVHGFIGKLADGTIATYQTLPWNMRGWHCGGTANNTHIGVEICEDGLTDSVYFGKVYKEAVELFSYLCKLYNLDPQTQIICHSEGFTLGVASNHSDVMHWFPKHGKSMDTFRADVKEKIAATDVPTTTTPTTPTDILEELNMTQAELTALINEQATKIADERIAANKTAVQNSAVSDYAKDAWKTAQDAGLMDGTMPQSPLQRQQFAAVAQRMGILSLNAEKEVSSWAKETIELFTKLGITDGTTPRGPVTMERVCVLIKRAFDTAGIELSE